LLLSARERGLRSVELRGNLPKLTVDATLVVLRGSHRRGGRHQQGSGQDGDHSCSDGTPHDD